MTDFVKDASECTPRVEMIADTGAVSLEGVCYPENAVDFFADIFVWLREYTLTARGTLTVGMALSYFNSSSSKCLLDLVELLDEYAQAGGRVKLSWHYEEDDEDLLESGEELAAGVSFPFELVMDKVEE